VLAAELGLLVLVDDVDPDELHAPSASAQMEAAARPTMDLRILGPTSQILDEKRVRSAAGFSLDRCAQS
jgi:hypothetical protein